MQRDEFVHSASSTHRAQAHRASVYGKSSGDRHLALPFCWLSFLHFSFDILGCYLKIICDKHHLSAEMKRFHTPENYYENCFGTAETSS